MPYFNIIIPKKYRIPEGATGVSYYDTFDLYNFTGFFNNEINLNKNILNFENKYFTGKTKGHVFLNHFYLFNDFEFASTGICECTNTTGIYISGYESKFITGNVFYNHYYVYDTFEQYNTGSILIATGDFQSGYIKSTTIGVFNFSGIY